MQFFNTYDRKGKINQSLEEEALTSFRKQIKNSEGCLVIMRYARGCRLTDTGGYEL